MELKERVNKNIKKLRKDAGYTQKTFAVEMGVKISSIGSYEENRSIPNLCFIVKASKLFDVRLDRLILKNIL